MERGSGGCGEMVWRLWRGGMEPVERSFVGCGKVVWRLRRGGLKDAVER